MPQSDAPTGTLETPSASLHDPALMAAAGFLAGYSGTTRVGYTIDLRGWWRFDAKRAHIELYVRSLEDRPSGSTARNSAPTPAAPSAGVRNPAGNVRRGGRDHALACLLGLNGLRVSEACNADIDNMALERGHRTLLVDRKGGKRALIPLAPRTARALDLAIGERSTGPILLANDGTQRLTRGGAYRIVKRLARRAGIPYKVGPHSLRHAFITAALDAGVPLRDVQEAASHSDPRTTSRYDRHRVSLDRHAAYTVAAFVAGATNGR